MRGEISTDAIYRVDQVDAFGEMPIFGDHSEVAGPFPLVHGTRRIGQCFADGSDRRAQHVLRVGFVADGVDDKGNNLFANFQLGEVAFPKLLGGHVTAYAAGAGPLAVLVQDWPGAGEDANRFAIRISKPLFRPLDDVTRFKGETARYRGPVIEEIARTHADKCLGRIAERARRRYERKRSRQIGFPREVTENFDEALKR